MAQGILSYLKHNLKHFLQYKMRIENNIIATEFKEYSTICIAKLLSLVAAIIVP